MENTGIQDKVDINNMLSASTINQYSNMKCNNESCYPLINGKMAPKKNQQFQHCLHPLLHQEIMNNIH